MKRYLLYFMILVLGYSNADSAGPIVFDTENTKNSLPITKVDISIRILGFLAETSTTLTISNPHDRPLEAELVFPLPEGIFISGYALDIDGVMRDGVAVERERGEIAFLDLERAGIDPGLMKMMSGNVFKTTIYPVESKGCRVVTIRYIEQLTREGGQLKYVLPLDYPKSIENARIGIFVSHTDKQPVIKGANQISPFKRIDDRYEAVYDGNELPDADILEILLKKEEVKNTVVCSASDGFEYFCINMNPEPEIPDEVSRNRLIPGHLAVCWDVSSSRGFSNHERELKLLEQYCELHSDQIKQIDLISFRNKSQLVKSYHRDKGEWADLIETIRAFDYDGATQIGRMIPDEYTEKPEMVFVFTDGMGNFGDSNFPQINVPVTVFSDDVECNHRELRRWARKSTGDFFYLPEVEIPDVLSRIGCKFFGLIEIVSSNDSVLELYPGPMSDVTSGFLICGKKRMGNAKLTARYGTHEKIYSNRLLDIHQRAVPECEWLTKVFASEKVSALIGEGGQRDAIRKTGMQYQIVTPETSLIVLEDAFEYLDYGVEPPASDPKLCEDVRSLRKEDESPSDMEEDRLEMLEDLIEEWDDLVAWWEKRFEYPENFKFSTPTPGPSETRLPWIETESRRVDPPRPSPTPREATFTNGTSQLLVKVHDIEGFMIPGVTVTVRKGQEDDYLTIVTGTDGLAIVRNLNSGTYELTMELMGLNTVSLPVTIRNGTVSEQSVTMEIMPFEQTVVACASTTSEPPADSASANVSIRPWNPDTPYVKKIQETSGDLQYQEYLRQKKEYGNSPAFYLDCADFFLTLNQPELGLRILSNLSEMQVDNSTILRVLGNRLKQIGELELSEAVFRRIIEINKFYPQNYRDLAMVLGEKKEYTEAIELLYKIITGEWQDSVDMYWDSFPSFGPVALVELNNFIDKAKRAGQSIPGVDPRLIRNLDVDLRIVVTWDSEYADMDLWVKEPSGEEAGYTNTLTSIGGHISEDCTEGLGPEEYLIRNAMSGPYSVSIDYFGNAGAQITGKVIVQVEMFTNYGRPNEQKKSTTMRLDETKDRITICEAVFE